MTYKIIKFLSKFQKAGLPEVYFGADDDGELYCGISLSPLKQLKLYWEGIGYEGAYTVQYKPQKQDKDGKWIAIVSEHLTLTTAIKRIKKIIIESATEDFIEAIRDAQLTEIDRLKTK